MSHYVTGIAVWNGDQGRLHLADQVITNAVISKKFKPGNGETFHVLIMRPEDAAAWGQFKHLYGHLYTPVAETTGETVADVHLRMKAEHFPDDGRSSLTHLSRAELKAYIEAVEQDIRENDPTSWQACCAAMSLYERRTH